MPRRNHRPRHHTRRPTSPQSPLEPVEVNDVDTERLARRLVLRGLRTVVILDRPDLRRTA